MQNVAPIRFLNSHVEFFPDDISTITDERGKGFHQATAGSQSMLGDYCRTVRCKAWTMTTNENLQPTFAFLKSLFNLELVYQNDFQLPSICWTS